MTLTAFWGDDGQAFNYVSTIKKLAKNKFLIILDKKDCWPLGEGNKSTCVDSTITYQLMGSKLAIIKKRKIKAVKIL